MQKTTQGEETNDLLRQIRNAILAGNKDTHRLVRHAQTIRQDVSGIREGRTGVDALQREDPLTAGQRFQVEEVKRRFRSRRERNPRCSLLAVSKEVFNEWIRKGIAPEFETYTKLNYRVWKEIQREDKGLMRY